MGSIRALYDPRSRLSHRPKFAFHITPTPDHRPTLAAVESDEVHVEICSRVLLLTERFEGKENDKKQGARTGLLQKLQDDFVGVCHVY